MAAIHGVGLAARADGAAEPAAARSSRLRRSLGFGGALAPGAASGLNVSSCQSFTRRSGLTISVTEVPIFDVVLPTCTAKLPGVVADEGAANDAGRASCTTVACGGLVPATNVSDAGVSDVDPASRLSEVAFRVKVELVKFNGPSLSGREAATTASV